MTAATLSYGRREPALGPSLALSALTHAILIAALFLGVRFQSSPPATVEVELWQPPPPPPPAPVVEQPKPPPPVVKPEPEPEVKKPQIALPEKPKPKPKPEPKVQAKPKPKPEPKRDLAFEKMLREEAMKEQQKLEAEREAARRDRDLKDLIARQQAAALQKALAAWSDKIRFKVRGNIILPQDIPGNPEAIFLVTLLPTGEVLNVRKKKSSGHPGYDDAVERAIMKSSPLPLPDDKSVFRRDLELIFQPRDR